MRQEQTGGTRKKKKTRNRIEGKQNSGGEEETQAEAMTLSMKQKARSPAMHSSRKGLVQM